MSDDSRAELFAGGIVLAVAAGFLLLAAGPRLMPGGGYDLIAAFPNVEGIETGSEIRMAGVPVDLEIYPGVVHGFIQFGRAIPEALKAHNDAARALRHAFGDQ